MHTETRYCRIHSTVAASLSLLSLVYFVAESAACTAFCVRLGEQILVGRSYDWHLNQAMLLVNPAGLEKSALSLENPARWISRYGSVTINQYGRELPCEGMNQVGLVVAVLWMDGTQYPNIDERPSLSSAQWVQYQLDTAATIDEVIDSDEQIRISPIGNIKVHYFIADATGACAVIAFLDGQQVVHCGPEFVSRAITNTECSASLRHLTDFLGLGGKQLLQPSTDSLTRFVCAAVGVQQLCERPEASHQEVFELLDKVRQPDSTQWQVVYDVPQRELRLRLGNETDVRMVDLQQWSMDDPRDVRMASLRELPIGKAATDLPAYDRRRNQAQIEYAFERTRMTRELPEFLKQAAVHYCDLQVRPASVTVEP